ncbi:hypothetical protein EDD95_0085 [Streptomyces sp. CEV 2-1]|nr:hypothetical protein EDD95_0085 [Streptomyces sp. CEV 2-1]
MHPLGGARDGDWQTERFDDEPSAEFFQQAVDEAGQQWPTGWVKGQGYITTVSVGDAETRYRFGEGVQLCLHTLTLDALAPCVQPVPEIDQSAATSVFWQAVSNQRPSSCLDITYSGAPSLSSPGAR